MTINEKKQLSNYIQRLVRESIGELHSDSVPSFLTDPYGGSGEFDDLLDDDDNFEEVDFEDEEEPEEAESYAGLDELRRLTESMARDAVKSMLYEKKGKKKKKSSKGDKKKGKSSDKTIIDRLNSDSVNSAHYFYKLYGVEDGTEAEKAAARSKGYKKAKGKKLPGKNGNYHFSSKERNKLNAMLTTDKN